MFSIRVSDVYIYYYYCSMQRVMCDAIVSNRRHARALFARRQEPTQSPHQISIEI